jgi:conjugative relaxase-like TrwC/TraI family protein
LVATLQFGTTSSYYALAYYHGGERQLAATWFARAGQFGLTDGQVVDADVFERLHAGRDVAGRSLLRSSREVDGLDLCFSPGKSISLAYAWTSDDALRAAILEAHRRAVRAALCVLEIEAVYTRRGKNGLKRERAPLTAALFTHDTARPSQHDDGSVFADVQIHTHAVILNLCPRSDGTFGGIDTRIGHWKMCAGSVYHAHLAQELSALGFSPQEIGSNGTFEIGLSARVRAFFSSRRAAIVECIGADNGGEPADPVAMAAAALRTRRVKNERDRDRDRFALWQAKARELGVEPEVSVADLRQAPPLTRFSEIEALQDRLAELPELLTEKEAAFPRRELLRQVACAHVGVGADPAQIVSLADKLAESDAVRQIRRSSLDEPIYSTPEMIEVERSVLSMAGDLAARRWRGVDLASLDAVARVAGLSNEQRNAVGALAEPKMLAFLEGAAGAGKTQALRPLVRELERQGFRVIAAAQAWRAANMLRKELGIEARAVDAWLAKADENAFVDSRTVLLVDEAGLIGSRAMQRLLRRFLSAAGGAEHGASGAKLIMVGDRKQLQPIAAGAGLKIVSHSVDGAALTEVRRQRDPGLKRVVELLSRGEVAPAIALLETRGAIDRQHSAQSAVEKAVRVWRERLKAQPDAEHLLLARSNASVRSLNIQARILRRAAGEIVGEDVQIEAVSPSGQAFVLPIAIGDRLRFGVRVDALNVINGTSAVVEAIGAAAGGQSHIVARVAGRTIAFDTAEIIDRKGRVRLAHDYAATIASSQGLTADTCTVLLEPTMDRNEFYVAASRSRGETQFVVDENAIDLLARSERRLKDGGASTSREERVAVLLRRLSRERIKTSTLDESRDAALDRSQAPNERILKSGARRERRRSREIVRE